MVASMEESINPILSYICNEEDATKEYFEDTYHQERYFPPYSNNVDFEPSPKIFRRNRQLSSAVYSAASSDVDMIYDISFGPKEEENFENKNTVHALDNFREVASSIDRSLKQMLSFKFIGDGSSNECFDQAFTKEANFTSNTNIDSINSLEVDIQKDLTRVSYIPDNFKNN